MGFKVSLQRFSTLLYAGLLLSLSSPFVLAENQNTDVQSADVATSVIQQTETTASSTEQNDKININTATITELEQLNGIGEKKAQAIVAYRDKHGNFTSIDQLTEISGIGSAIIAKNKHNLTF